VKIEWDGKRSELHDLCETCAAPPTPEEELDALSALLKVLEETQ
jgi:hypothetical protein